MMEYLVISDLFLLTWLVSISTGFKLVSAEVIKIYVIILDLVHTKYPAPEDDWNQT